MVASLRATREVALRWLGTDQLAPCGIRRKKLKGTNFVWKGWYAFRRGPGDESVSLWSYRCGLRLESLILRNSAEVVDARYIRLEQEGTKIDAMARHEQA